jgi:predicted MFS family arabinose efflux permease
MMAEVLSGLTHVLAVPQIRSTMLCCFVFCLFAAGLWALLPLVVKHMVGGEASIYGAMLGAIGIGALVGALMINWTRQAFGLRRLFFLSTTAFAISTTALALLQSVPLLMIALAFGGIGWMMTMSTFNVVVQMAAGDGFKGRAVSVYYVALFGGIALGSWLWGHVAETVSIKAALLASAAGLFASLILYRRGTRLAAHFDAASSG